MVVQPDLLDVVFRAVADPTRRAMVRRLSQGERSVSELAEPFDMSLAAASKHIKVLESAGIIRRTIRGRRHICRLSAEPLVEARQWLEYYEQFWNARLDDLERALESESPDQPTPPDHAAD